MASTPGGMASPSVLAVLRLITSSNLVGCMTGRAGGFAPAMILPALNANLAICVGKVRAIANKATSRDKLAPIVNRRNFVVRRQHNDLMKTADKEWIGTDDERTAALSKRGENIVDIAFAAGI